MQAYLNPEQNEQLEMAATYLRDRLLIRLLRQSGCRISEALGLSTEDIDLVKGEMIILHLKTRVKMLCPDCQARLGRSHSFCPGCGRRLGGQRAGLPKSAVEPTSCVKRRRLFSTSDEAGGSCEGQRRRPRMGMRSPDS